MPNTNVFRGSDAALVLAVDDAETAEGKLADGLITEYDLSTVVGRLQQVQVRVEQDLRPYHELGRRFASALLPGRINVSGSADRAHINGALLRLLLGDGAASPPPTTSFPQPSFNLVINLTSPGQEDVASKLVVFGVQFETWNATFPEDDFVMESVTFKALRITIEEPAGAGAAGEGAGA